MNLLKTSVAALSLALLGAPAMAQQQRGLVNVNIGDITVQVPVAIAANVCGVAVNVLATQLGTSDVECNAEADAAADNQQLMRAAEAQGVADDILALLG